MQFNESKLYAAIETARAKANGNKASLNAIDKATPERQARQTNIRACDKSRA
jgi:hypothetical protein